MTTPYSPYTTDMSVIADLLVAKIDLAKANFRIPVELVFYGDQDRIPKTPAICVDPSDLSREISGAPDMTTNDMLLYIMIYHNKAQDNSTTRREVDMIAYDVTQLIHADLQLTTGGPTPNMIHNYVRAYESGYTYKRDTLYRSGRLSYFGRNKTSLRGEGS
jgi:hypothetical protein